MTEARLTAEPSNRETRSVTVEQLAAALRPHFGPSYFPGLHDVTIIGKTPEDVADAIFAALPAESAESDGLPAAAPAEGLREALMRAAGLLNPPYPDARDGQRGRRWADIDEALDIVVAALARQGEAELSESRHHESAGSE